MATQSIFEGLETRRLFGYPFDEAQPDEVPCPDQSEAPIAYATGRQSVISTDLVSNAFGQSFGQIRSWTGVNDASQTGNGWAVNSLSYIVVSLNQFTGSGHGGMISVIRDGITVAKFDVDATGDVFTARENALEKLMYVPPTDSGSTKVPGKFRLTDAQGNVTTYFDVPRATGSGDLIQPQIGGPKYGRMFLGKGRPQQITRDWFDTTDGTFYSGSSGAPAYRFGAFESYEDASTNLKVKATYDSTGNLSTVVRTDGSGAFERFSYTYDEKMNNANADTVTGGSGDARDWFITDVVLSRATGTAGSYTVPTSWTDVRKVSYQYYIGTGADAKYGRFGDLKHVAIKTPSGSIIEEKYYRYNKLPGQQYNEGSMASPYALKVSSGNLIDNTAGQDKTFEAETGDWVAQSGLKSVFEGAAYARLTAALGNLSAIEDDSDSQVNPFAQYIFTYERAPSDQTNSSSTRYRVVQEIAAAKGCTTCSDGFGVYRFQYDSLGAINRYDTTANENVATVRTTEWLSDATNPLLKAGNVATGVAVNEVDDKATFTWPNHGFQVGEEVTIEGVDADLFGFPVVIESADANTFTVPIESTATAPTTGVIVVHAERNITIRFANVSYASGDVTVSWLGHNFHVGEEIKVEGTGSNLGTFEITAVTEDAFTYAASGAPTGGFTITNLDQVDPAAWNDNEQHVVYTNERGQILLKALAEKSVSVTAASGSSGTMVYTAADHGFNVGDLVQVTSSTRGTLQTARITAKTDNTFTVSGSHTLGFEYFYVQRVFATANVYDERNRLSVIAHSSGIEGYNSNLSTLNFKASEGRFDVSLYHNSSTDSGLGDGDALADAEGNVQYYLKETGIARGYTAATNTTTSSSYTKLSSFKYYQMVSDLDAANIVYPLAERVDYWSVSSTSDLGTVLGTKTAYTYYRLKIGADKTNRIEMMTVHDAAVSSERNGSGSTSTRTAVYDTTGRRVWYRDGDGFISYIDYSPTGAVRTFIADVDTSLVSNEPVDPSTSAPWSTPSGAGLHLTTRHQSDGLGRITRTINPKGNISYIVYDDPNHSVRTYAGWDPAAGTVTGPTTVRRDDWTNKYRETLSMTLTPNVTSDAITQVSRSGSTATVDTTNPHGLITGDTVTITGAAQSEYNGTFIVTVTDSDSFTYLVSGSPATPATGTPALNRRPSGTESIGSATIHSLTRQLNNDAGQIIETDRYFSMPSGGYNATTAYLGTDSNDSGSGQYHDTLQQFDGRGRLKRVETASGTVTRYLYDGRGLLREIWIGTNDVPTGSPGNGQFWPTYTTGTDMTPVEIREYDENGNLLKVTKKPGGAADRVTTLTYDWRDRLVASKSGSEATTESTSLNRQLTYYTYDNQNRVTSVSTYDADAVTLSDSDGDGIPNAPADSLMGSRTETLYDDRGRPYASVQRFVNPSATPVVHGTKKLTTGVWYDHRNNVIKQTPPGAAATKTQFDGAGRVTKSFVTDAGGDTSYAHAKDVSGDEVLEQTEYARDANGNVTITTRRQRFDSASATGELGNAGSGTSAARVYYTASYFDKLDRITRTINVGTNGGSAYTETDRGTDASASRSNTKLITDYEYDDASRLWRATNPRNFKTVTYFDLLGRKKKIIDAYVDGDVSDGNDRTTMYTYTGAGNMLTLRAMMPDSADSGSDPDYQETMYVYGVSGSSGSSIVSNELLQAVYYPERDDATNKGGDGDDEWGEASASEAESYAYNALGEKITMTDRRGVEHTYSYDLMGRLTSDKVTNWGSNSSSIDQYVDEITYSFDSAGRRLAVTSRENVAPASTRNDVRYAYNGFGQVVTEAQNHYGSANVSTSVRTTYTYSEGVAESGSSSSNHSRLKQISFTDNVSTNEVNYTYSSANDLNDIISRVGSVKSGSTTVESYTYLGLGTYVQIDRPEAGTKLTYITSSTGVTSGDRYKGLDSFGRVYDQNWMSGSTVTDATNYSYDRNGNRYKKDVVTSGAPSSGANQVDEQFAYDMLDRLVEARRGYFDSATTMNSVTWLAGWSLDTLGNIKGYMTVTDPTFGDADLDGDIDFEDLVTESQNYGEEHSLWTDADFDGDGTVDFDDLLYITQNYDFDTGNSQTTQSRGHNRQNQITWIDDANWGVEDSGEQLDYDASGSNTLDQDGRVLKYDAWNRQVSITDTDGTTLISQYWYDGLSRQITIDSREQYFNKDWQIFFEYDSANDGTTKYVWSPVYVDALILRDMDYNANGDWDDTNERVYSQWDANFNVTSITSISGSVLERYRYEPYGQRTVLNADFSVDTLAGSDSTTSDDATASWNTSDVFFRAGHQGGMYDVAVQEKMQFRYRGLDVEQMRWGQVDPIASVGEFPTDSVTTVAHARAMLEARARFGSEHGNDKWLWRFVDGANTYQGFSHNPTTFRDPSGLDVWVESDVGIGIMGHRRLGVGDPLGECTFYSFGLESRWQVFNPFAEGTVYYDDRPPGSQQAMIIGRVTMTPEQDADFKKTTDAMVGMKMPYRITYPNCRTFCGDLRDLAQRTYAPPPMPPPKPTYLPPFHLPIGQ